MEIIPIFSESWHRPLEWFASSAWAVCIFRLGSLHIPVGVVCISRLNGLHLPLGESPSPLNIPTPTSAPASLLGDTRELIAQQLIPIIYNWIIRSLIDSSQFIVILFEMFPKLSLGIPKYSSRQIRASGNDEDLRTTS